MKCGYFSLHSLIASFPACIKSYKSWDMYQVKIKTAQVLLLNRLVLTGCSWKSLRLFYTYKDDFELFILPANHEF